MYIASDIQHDYLLFEPPGTHAVGGSETRGIPTPIPYVYIRVKWKVSHADNHLFHLAMSLKCLYQTRYVECPWSTSNRRQSRRVVTDL